MSSLPGLLARATSIGPDTGRAPQASGRPAGARRPVLTPWIALAILAWASTAPGVQAADPASDYDARVKPLLATHCVRCHGESNPKGGLRLDTAKEIAAGGASGPVVVPGDAANSPLLHAVLGTGLTERMPLKKPPLTGPDVTAIRRWIDAGAKGPANETSSVPPAHWSFVPSASPPLPAVRNAAAVRNPVDRFVVARLEEAGIEVSPDADRVTLLRRASLDLTGLPPGPEEVGSFLADEGGKAYERLVDRLLASPHYGERWGRLWLDGARYADSNGYSIDAPRQIWPYRDWVIQALNRDQPFDEFTVDQLAGDLRPDATLDQRVATGFHRNTPINQEGGIDVEQFRIDSIHDRVATTASVWLGLTLGCSQCHDHKYDPLTQKDYYGLFAFFDNVDEVDLPLATPEMIARADAADQAVREYLTGIAAKDPSLWTRQKEWEASLDMVGRQKQSQEVRTAFDVVFEKRSEAQRQIVFAAFVDQSSGAMDHRDAIGAIRKEAPVIRTSMVVRERPQPRVTRFLVAGDFTRPREQVRPDVPAALPRLAVPAHGANRMDLAKWLVDPRNPLTARVTVNRIWQAYFGRGLVETENDLGTQGALPSHPGLLDYLATEFVRGGWSLKALHRLIVTSATYRRSSRVREDLAAVDPDNRWLARQSRVRLDAELVRDSALAVSGLLAPGVGGPSVFPPQPEGVMHLGQMRREWNPSSGDDRYRRGMYTHLWRATPHPMFTLFDAPDGTRSCTRRSRSNTPLQALMLLNDESFVECAAALARRVLEARTTDSQRLELLFRIGVARAPSPKEHDRLNRLLRQQQDAGRTDRAAWTTLARTVLNLDEFITRE